MPLDTTLSDIIRRLREGRFPNEQAVSQGIVLRLLSELGWETYDTDSVWPEYQTGEGRVDFALCSRPRKPAVFIEVKQPDKAASGIRQTLEYAFHTGVPFVVLTDGKTWSFYLPAEQGSYEERRVHLLDLFERDTDAAIEILRRYLNRDAVISGESLEYARREYRAKNRSAQARESLPEAWAELVAEGDEQLIELVAAAVETKAGVRPGDDDVIAFLNSLRIPVTFQSSTTQSTSPKAQPAATTLPAFANPAQAQPQLRRGELVFRNKKFPYTNAKEAVIFVLTELAKADATFLERCANHPEIRGRKRQYIARTPAELYPDRPDLHEFNEPLPGGWFLATNLNNGFKMRVLRIAAEVAGLRFGTDLVIDL